MDTKFPLPISNVTDAERKAISKRIAESETFMLWIPEIQRTKTDLKTLTTILLMNGVNKAMKPGMMTPGRFRKTEHDPRTMRRPRVCSIRMSGANHY